MPDWATFAVIAGVVLASLLLLARVSQDALVRSPTTDRPASWDDPELDRGEPAAEATDSDGGRVVRGGSPDPPVEPRRVPSTGALFASVALSQSVFGLLLLGGVLVTGVPVAALGISAESAGREAVVSGVALGVALYVLDELAAAAGRRHGLGGGEALRSVLAPQSAREWAVLLGGVLPVVAGFEELLFRGVLVGALNAGFGISPWLLAVVSSVAFGLGHGAQGPAGVLVTGLLGLVLAVAFVLTGSLLSVVVAHYLVNALEFVVHEGLDVDVLILK